MKKITKTLTILGVAFMLPLSAKAYSDAEFHSLHTESKNGLYTVITDTEGETHALDGVIDADSIDKSQCAEKISAYTVFNSDREVITVELKDVKDRGAISLFSDEPLTNGYYAVTVTLSEEDNTELFIAGLTRDSMVQVQREAVGAVMENSEFSFEHIDFIDTEKLKEPSTDDLLCWAASTANGLWYTGWGRMAGFKSEDDLFDLFHENFTDSGGNEYFGFPWFFNGLYEPCVVDAYGEGWSQYKHDYSEAEIRFPDYSVYELMDYYSVKKDHTQISGLVEGLRNGCSVHLGVGWYDSGESNGGHAIAAFGFIIDKDYTEEDSEYLKAIIVADSDSDRVAQSNRRMSPNKLNVLNTVPYTEYGFDTFRFDGYDDGLLVDYLVLKPYSEDLPKETDESATKNPKTTPDFSVDEDETCLQSDDEGLNYNEVFYTTDSVHVCLASANCSDVKYTGDVPFSAEVINKETEETVETKTGEVIDPAHFGYDGERTGYAALSPLAAGKYTVKITLNPEKTVSEAYYYNNTYETDIRIIEPPFDMSSAKLSATFGDLSEGKIDTSLSLNLTEEELDNLRTTFYGDGYEECIYVKDTAEDEWYNISFDSDPFNEQLQIPPNGMESVQFAYMIMKDGLPDTIIYSDEYELQVPRLTVNKASADVIQYTGLDSGEKALKNGEKFAFTVTNDSTDSSASVTGTWTVYAFDGENEEIVLKSGEITLAKGETSAVIEVDSWDEELAGAYFIFAGAECESGKDLDILGTLGVKEKPGIVVTTAKDRVDEYDGKTSLREAIALCGENDTITFDESLDEVNLDEPLQIDKKVTIEGQLAFDADYPDEMQAVIINCQNSVTAFEVSETGNLILNSIAVNRGYSELNGGAILNNGGALEINNSRFFKSNAARAGGAIYSDGGNVILRGVSFKENSAGYGGAIAAVNNAEINAINCNFFGNTSNQGAVYNQSSAFTAVYSTFLDNTAESSGGGAVTNSNGTANIISSIVLLNGDTQLSETEAIGSYTDNAERMVYMPDGKSVWEYYGNRAVCYYPRLTEETKLGYYVKNSNGKIAYSADGEEWTETDIKSVFTDDEYGKDITGAKKDGGLYGSYAEVYDKTEIVNDGTVYLGKEQSAVIVATAKDESGALVGVEIHEITDIGTVTIDLTGDEFTRGENNIELMLWNSIDGMMPLCEKY